MQGENGQRVGKKKEVTIQMTAVTQKKLKTLAAIWEMTMGECVDALMKPYESDLLRLGVGTEQEAIPCA